jgi:hypothetical protein
MTYDDRKKSLWHAATGTVIYRSNMHLGLKKKLSGDAQRPFDLIGIAIDRVQAQYPMGAMLAAAK